MWRRKLAPRAPTTSKSACAASTRASRLRRVVVHGDVSQRILEYEQELDCDLIVVGKHGAGVFEELLLGSTTKHLLAESQSDVLVVA